METSQLKAYAPAARRDFITAVSTQAARFGITSKGIESTKVDGDVLIIGGQAFPKAYAGPRSSLVNRVQSDDFYATMEAIAYTWFNRFVAIRYMELHDYLDHGYRVLSHPEGDNRPQILEFAAEIELLGLNKAKVVELKLDGTKDEELFRLILKAQCNALHRAMPFLFDPIGSETELLLPANLLHTDSLIRKLVNEIDESAWDHIEVIGWLYQFYISEKKDEVIGKVVKSEDIPAATQLFTPNWIVKYMVQNTLGAQWMATYPDSPLKDQMEFYIEPAEQTEEVKKQLKGITPSSLNPEEITLIDPACGSGHILVEAYDLFKAIYLERGYRQRDIPQLILEKNLFGLDIDQRAAQLTGFSLMMKGRADERRLLGRELKLNVTALVDSVVFDVIGLSKAVELGDYGLELEDLTELKSLFEHAATLGSLIQVPEELTKKLPALKELCLVTRQDLFASDVIKRLRPLVWQAEILASEYDVVVANPPYMGNKFYCNEVKKFVKDRFPNFKRDLFACFMARALSLAAVNSRFSLITIPSWLFLSSFEMLREGVISRSTITSLLHMGRGIFGIDFGSVAFVAQKTAAPGARGRFFRLHKRNFQHIHIPDIAQLFCNALKNPNFKYDFDCYRGPELGTRIPIEPMPDGQKIHFVAQQSEFRKIPGSPFAFWISGRMRSYFETAPSVAKVLTPKHGLSTGNNELFLRLWHEINFVQFNRSCMSATECASSRLSWYPYSKGGHFRKWFGNRNHVLNYLEGGRTMQAAAMQGELPGFRHDGREFFFREGGTWSNISSNFLSMRYMPGAFCFDQKGSGLFAKDSKTLYKAILYFNSTVAREYLSLICPTLDFSGGGIGRLPFLQGEEEGDGWIDPLFSRLVEIAQNDWDAFERSWDFQSFSLMTVFSDLTPTLESTYTTWITQNRDTIAEMKRLEEENNRLFIDEYDLQAELTPDVPIEQITLTVNPAYRYGGKLTEEEQWTRFREDTMKELISYSVGCMMGRYGLDEPGLIYAHSGNEGFDHKRYTTFPADDDGIVPLTDTNWFEDDACNRVVEFISVAWNKDKLEENLSFLAKNLSPKKNETSRDTIRRYLCNHFFKDHLKTYKKRPIYWLFSSGKKKAFQCLVYLHRYNEGTLARMRSEYVIPLQGKLAARLEKLNADITKASSTAHRKKLEKEKSKLEKQQIELLAFDEKLRHYADQRIVLDLDDGVKVNYGKFGSLLPDAKAIHGKKPEGV